MTLDNEVRKTTRKYVLAGAVIGGALFGGIFYDAMYKKHVGDKSALNLLWYVALGSAFGGATGNAMAQGYSPAYRKQDEEEILEKDLNEIDI